MEFFVYLYCVKAYTLLAILIEMVYLYAWPSGATAKFAGMPHKLKFYQKKSAERLKKLRKLIVDNYVMRNADSSPSRRRFLSLYTDIISMLEYSDCMQLKNFDCKKYFD